jgi:hypothetical protein
MIVSSFFKSRTSMAVGLLVAALVALSLGACNGGDESTERGPLGEAELLGSCQAPDGGNYCGDQSADGCWCDESCSDYGDCCQDSDSICSGSNDCEAAGGECQAITPTFCSDGTSSDLSCGGGLGVGCCMVDDDLTPSNDCEAAGGECQAITPTFCSDGTSSNLSCGGGLGVGCCMTN